MSEDGSAATADTARLVIGTPNADVEILAEQLDAELELLPPIGEVDALDKWRRNASSAKFRTEIVVAAWPDAPRSGTLIEVEAEEWRLRCEAPLLAWQVALSAAADRCANGGALVAVVDTPPGLDCAGWVPETSVAQAVGNLVRSLAQTEGPRDVRVNAVSTPARLVGIGADMAPGCPPPLATRFPGTIDREVAGAVRTLLGRDASGLSGVTIAADAGRAW